MKDTKMDQKDIKYVFAYFNKDNLNEDIEHCKDKQKIEKFIRDKIGKEIIALYGDTDDMLECLDILHHEGIINYSCVFALIRHWQDSRIAYFFIKKTELLAKKLKVKTENYDKWIGVLIKGSIGGVGYGFDALLHAATLYVTDADDKILDDIVNDIMSCEITEDEINNTLYNMSIYT